MNHNNSWVIVFLIYADFRSLVGRTSGTHILLSKEMKLELDLMFKDILTSPLVPGRARAFVILDLIHDVTDVEGSPMVMSKTVLYGIHNPASMPFNDFNDHDFKILDDQQIPAGGKFPDQPTQQAAHLTNIFKQIDVKKEEEVLLVTWDHGAAFGIFREEKADIPRVEIMKPITDDLESFPYLKKFWDRALKTGQFKTEGENSERTLIKVGSSFFTDRPSAQPEQIKKALLFIQAGLTPAEAPETFSSLFQREDPEILRNEELGIAIKEWLKDKSVGVLLMMNCWMMNLHTMYALRQQVQCLVAPQGDIANPGYNYRDILAYLNKRDEVSPQKLAIKCVTKTENSRAKKRAKKFNPKKSNTIDTWKIIAADLQKKGSYSTALEEHLDLLNDIIERLQPISEKEIPATYFKQIRLLSYDFTNAGSIMVDIVNWLYAIYAVNTTLPQRDQFIDAKTCDQILALRHNVVNELAESNIILAASEGKLIYGNTQPVLGLAPTGYSIFFPRSVIANPDIINHVKNDSLLKGVLFSWKFFLESLYGELGFQ